jgi:hypothetical protein
MPDKGLLYWTGLQLIRKQRRERCHSESFRTPSPILDASISVGCPWPLRGRSLRDVLEMTIVLTGRSRKRMPHTIADREKAKNPTNYYYESTHALLECRLAGQPDHGLVKETVRLVSVYISSGAERRFRSSETVPKLSPNWDARIKCLLSRRAMSLEPPRFHESNYSADSVDLQHFTRSDRSIEPWERS